MYLQTVLFLCVSSPTLCLFFWGMDRGAWWATVHRVTKSQTRLSDWAQAHMSFSYSFVEAMYSINTYWASVCAEYPCTGDGTGTMSTIPWTLTVHRTMLSDSQRSAVNSVLLPSPPWTQYCWHPRCELSTAGIPTVSSVLLPSLLWAQYSIQPRSELSTLAIPALSSVLLPCPLWTQHSCHPRCELSTPGIPLWAQYCCHPRCALTLRHGEAAGHAQSHVACEQQNQSFFPDLVNTLHSPGNSGCRQTQELKKGWWLEGKHSPW